ncbi:MAG: hypothetical protein HOH59_15100 [Rhodospirillaceae bacterium]|jgi:hypothetical protein|nr:hypothetical protein [Rhodospirillaceae bacterium]
MKQSTEYFVESEFTMTKIFEGLCSFLLFGSAATGLIMIFVLVAEFELEEWGIAPAVILTICILIFLLSWAWYRKLRS